MYQTITFSKKHFRNFLKTCKDYKYNVNIIDEYNNSLGMSQIRKYKGRIQNFKISSYPDVAEYKVTLNLTLLFKKSEVEFYIPADSEIYYGDITKGEKYQISWINSGPKCYLEFDCW